MKQSAGHCLHTTDERVRYCCWCGFDQHPVADPDPVHGPRYAGDRWRWHWEPTSVGGVCARDVDDVEDVPA